jgi:SAM-dependent methyltransferase
VPRPSADRFDAAFYRRHYFDPRTRVVTRRDMERRAELVAAFTRHARLRVRRILDAGCGLGLMRESLLRALPGARYVGLEASAWVCERHGWVHGSVATYRAPHAYDLVVCYDVLQYLDDRSAAAALANLARLCRGVLHFGVLTQEDWDRYCDRSTTDRNVHLRPGAWYRERLGRGFLNAGCGMFVRRGAPVHLWELERPDPARSGRRG